MVGWEVGPERRFPDFQVKKCKKGCSVGHRRNPGAREDPDCMLEA